jgi:hypothetical protein
MTDRPRRRERSHEARRALAAALLLAAFAPFLAAQAGGRGLTVVKGVGSIEGLKGNAGKRYALCIGIDDFKDPAIPALKGARNDASELAETLKKYGQFDVVEKMTDDIDPAYDGAKAYPGLSNVRAKLAALAERIKPEDLLVFFFAGHGIATEEGEGYLLLADTASAAKWDSSLPIKEVLAWVAKTKVRKSLLILDACRVTMERSASRGLVPTSLRADKYERSAVSAVFYATKTGWASYDDPNSSHGIFTKFLLEGIKGKADYQGGNGDGIVTFSELSSFVEAQVTSYAHEQRLDQSPSVAYNGEAFGELAVSTYSASIDTATRIDKALSSSLAGEGSGSLALYSNAEGTIEIDGEGRGGIARGQTLDLGELASGRHRLVISHVYGLFDKEFDVLPGAVTHVANIVINRPERENRQVGDMPFVFVQGSGQLPGFWMGMTEVRFDQFANFVRQSGYKSKGSWERYYKPAYGYYPVIHVTWEDCAAYAQWFSKKFKVKAALASLSQWQHAAGARYGTAYPWGDEWDPDYCQCSGSKAPDALPLEGGSGPLQELFFLNDITLDGVKMLAGNVSEWCADKKKADDGTTDVAASAGGSWRLNKPKYFTASYAEFKAVTSEDEDQGFRIVLQAD